MDGSDRQDTQGTKIRTDVNGSDVDHGAVGLVGDAIDLLEGEGVGEELVLGGGDDVL